MDLFGDAPAISKVEDTAQNITYSDAITPFLDKVFCDDCFNIIAKLPEKSLDLVIVDPPYGTSGDTNGYGRKGKEILNDSDESINYKFLDAIFPKMKDNTSLYLFCDHKYCDKIKAHSINTGFTYRMVCVMVKNNIGMGHPFRNQHEFCLVLEKGEPEYYRKDMSTVWKMKHIAHDDDSHPHQKDYDILRKIILHSSKEGDIIFDAFGGSFSTFLCCYRENRKFIGTELDPKWYALGDRKLKDLMSQKTMF